MGKSGAEQKTDTEHKMNAEQFGLFIAQMRKEQGLTQKQLAEKVFVSDKAVSKWERG